MRRDPARRGHCRLLRLTVLLVVAAALGAGAGQRVTPSPAADDASSQPVVSDDAGAWSPASLFDAEAAGGDGPSDQAVGAADASDAAAAQGASEPPDHSPADQIAARVGDAEPVEVIVPGIGVRAPLIRLGLQSDGTMEVPEEDFMEAGWYEHGPRPGLRGPSVVAGHVDSMDGPAVFYDLDKLAPGDEVVVRYDNAETVAFRIERIEQHPKDHFPTEEVYADTEAPELRLVTCGGLFDRNQRSYKDNIIAFATVADGGT